MKPRLRLARVPLESAASLRLLAAVRAALALSALIAAVALDIPHGGRLALLIGVVAVPWSLALVAAGRRAPELSVTGTVAVVDIAVLAVVELAAPASYAAVRFIAIAVIAAHAATQGEQRALLVALLGIAVLIPVSDATGPPLRGGVLVFCEIMFALAALAVGLLIGRLRTAESTGRLRARDLSRRAIEAENRMRRRVAESIHDGPVQELVSLDMVLETVRRALARGDATRAAERLDEARRLTERNIGALRDEIIGLGPYAFDELSLNAAIEQCVAVWSRRYDINVELSLEHLDLPNAVSGALFGIAQEAVANAGRHSGASDVRVSLRLTDGEVELRVADQGHGFGDAPPLGPTVPAHIGLASMRERAELQGGTLEIDSSEAGATVSARIPLGPAPSDEGRRAHAITPG